MGITLLQRIDQISDIVRGLERTHESMLVEVRAGERRKVLKAIADLARERFWPHEIMDQIRALYPGDCDA